MCEREELVLDRRAAELRRRLRAVERAGVVRRPTLGLRRRHQRRRAAGRVFRGGEQLVGGGARGGACLLRAQRRDDLVVRLGERLDVARRLRRDLEEVVGRFDRDDLLDRALVETDRGREERRARHAGQRLAARDRR